MSVRSFTDSNIFVDAYDKDAGAKQTIAIDLIDGLGGAGELSISTQVLKELYWVVTRKLSPALPAETAEQVVRDLARYPLALEDPPLVLDAIGRSRRDGLALRDALIVEAARRAKARVLYTEDLQHGRDFDGVRAENPFHELP